MDIFIARQGIYDLNEKVVAYELLYRNSIKNKYDIEIEDEKATYQVIDNISSFGLDVLTENKKAFVNFSEQVIKDNVATLLPKDNVVIEVLETVNPSQEIINKLTSLKELGYSIALDDVVSLDYVKKFVGVVDIVKIDFMLCSKEERKEVVFFCKKNNIKVLAEKIETKEDLFEAKNLDCDYFQGYYYSKPSVFLGKDISIKNTSIFMLLVELVRENFNLDKVDYIMKTDLALTYKFLRFINSSYFNFLQEVKSIKQAIMLIGRGELRKWLSILTVSEMSPQNEEYTKNIIIRARLCEEIAGSINLKDSSSAFMVGLFYNIDEMIDKDINYVVKTLPLNKDVKRALLGEKNIYRNILELAIAYEKLDKENIEKFCKKLLINEGELLDLYYKSLEWGRNISN
ncbi:MAG: EAL domain-containing protein [Clostridium sp.]|uniref:EAL and HDOD domain-containing protein n=1 Tax=Clostridium sp. TaxID=1506 RepID=UPI002910F452|nr:EAL domain-containing protein [Clostridium sp.]MDU5109399.1 EAL domain-containing protein [Clostridium sp.]